MASLTDLEAASIGVAATIHRYAQRGDAGDAAALAATFLPDGVLETERGGAVRGRAAIQEYIASIAAAVPAEVPRPRFVRHHVSDIDVTELDADGVASVRSYFLVLTDGPDGASRIDHSGRYRDRMRRDVDGVWRFEHRSVRLDAPPLGAIFQTALPGFEDRPAADDN